MAVSGGLDTGMRSLFKFLVICQNKDRGATLDYANWLNLGENRT